MVFVQLCNKCDNFLSHTHIMFSLFLSIALISVSIPTFLCKFMVVLKLVTQMLVQITHLFLRGQMFFIIYNIYATSLIVVNIFFF